MDPRLRARRIEVARSQGRRRRRRIVALALVTVLVLAAVGLSRSVLLDVDVLTVAGATRTGEATVRDVAGIRRGRAMTSIDPDAVEARLEARPWVADASVRRKWPGTVRIEVRERVPAAIVDAGASATVVDGEGRLLGPATAADADLPSAGPSSGAEVGERLPAARRRLVAVLAALPAELRAEVERGTIGADGLGLLLDDGVEVRLGDPTRLQAKADAALVLLAEADRATMAVVDVSVDGTAAVTRTEDPALTPSEPGGA
jgi:cell division protein FtsQ